MLPISMKITSNRPFSRFLIARIFEIIPKDFRNFKLSIWVNQIVHALVGYIFDLMILLGLSSE